MTRLSQLLLTVLGLPAITLAAAAPVRILLVANSGQLIDEAKARFAAKHGPERIAVTVRDETLDPEEFSGQDVIFLFYARPESLNRLAKAAQAAHSRGAVVLAAPVAVVSQVWSLALPEAPSLAAERYWLGGGLANFVELLGHLHNQARGVTKVAVAPPTAPESAGIYHPAAPRTFSRLADYLAWYELRQRPLVGVFFFSQHYKSGDLAAVDAAIATLERRGWGAVAAFGWPVRELEQVLRVDGRSPLRAILAGNLTVGRPEDGAVLERFGVPVINWMATRESLAEYQANPRGIPPDRVHPLLNSPEKAGAIEPILGSTFEGTAAKQTRPIAERLDRAISRLERWIALQEKPNAAKRLAILYYNSPPGRGNLGASYLGIFPSLLAILERLRQAGWQTGSAAPSERQLAAMLERSGRNLEQWEQGELERMAESGVAGFVSMTQYKAWLAELPAGFRKAVTGRWGTPEQSRLMTIQAATGERFFVIPGRKFGNVYVGPQSLRSTFEEAQNAAHDPVTPPPHSYVAAYLWYRNVFRADALLHLGRHGTLEWLPGKQVALNEDDPADVLLGDLPNPYVYIMDGGGEAIQAKRRAAATIVSHLTPLIVSAGEIEEFEPLHQILDQWEQVGEDLVELRQEYERQAKRFIADKRLDRQLRVNVETSSWEEVRRKIHVFLHELEDQPIPAGIAALGRLPDEELIQEAVAQLKHAGFTGAEADRWEAALRESPRRELDTVAAVLEGRFVPSGLMGDPLKTPAALPSGRNLHAFDANLIPTKAACAVGRQLGDATLERYRKEQGRLPEKISLVLFYGETERHQGAMECMAMWLLGVEPVWNERGVVDSLRLIPPEELKRPRVDVVATLSGIYRDGFPDKALLLDKAVRLAAEAEGGEAIRRHDAEVAALLRQQGVAPETAARLARARLFSSKPGAYGISLVKMVEQSRNFQNEAAMAKLYYQAMNHAFSTESWGEGVPGALEGHLKGNQAVVFSRSSNLYGVLDNDDSYTYAGGLNLATKLANGGLAPQFYIQNHRRSGRESLTDLKSWLTSELNARNWNPKWLREMQKSGYAGAREMFREVEHLYGFEATAREQMDSAFWQNTYDVYVADKHKLGMRAFFRQENPSAEQMLVARLLEVDRQGAYSFTAVERQELIRRYVESVNRSGISCAANTCGNRALLDHIQRQAQQALQSKDVLRFRERIRVATERVGELNERRPITKSPSKTNGQSLRTLFGKGVRWVNNPFASFDPAKAMRVSLTSLAVLAGLWLTGITGVWSRIRRGEALTVRSLLD